MYSHATKTLFPTVRGQQLTASPEEIAEYCSSLLRIGSVQEVRRLLDTIKNGHNPDVTFCSAFLEIVEWNYSAAADHLTRYLEFELPRNYQRSVAEVNLAIALVGCARYDEALQLLHRIIADSKRLDQPMVHATCLCYLGDLYLEINELSLAESTLLEATKLVPSSDFQLHLLMAKLDAILRFQKNPGETELKVFDTIKERARKQNVYEILRGCDFAKAKFNRDENAFLACYVGTSYPSFRTKCEKLSFDLPKEICVTRLGNGDVICSPSVSDGYDLSDPQDMNAGQSIHNSLLALNLDFYRPQSIGGLYEYLYPQTHFDPFTAPNRIHKLVLRLRSWINKQGFPWKVVMDKNGVQLITGPETPILISLEQSRNPVGPRELLLRQIYKKFHNSQFSLEDLAVNNLCRPSQARACIEEALKNGIVQRSGKGRYTCYRFLRPPSA